MRGTAGEKLGGGEGGETVIRTYYVFNKKKVKINR